jgi:hypothetical protein
MPFVQSPIPMDGNPHQIQLVERDPQSPNGALQNGRERYVESHPLFFQRTSGLLRLYSAVIGQIYVRPAAEEILLVPHALPVSQENQLPVEAFGGFIHRSASCISSSAAFDRCHDGVRRG